MTVAEHRRLKAQERREELDGAVRGAAKAIASGVPAAQRIDNGADYQSRPFDERAWSFFKGLYLTREQTSN